MNIDQAVDIAKPYSKCPRRRLAVYAETLKKLDHQKIEGAVVECGVWRGGGVILARLLSPDRIIWLYDTFNGMANRSKFDFKPGGYKMSEGKAAVSLVQVVANLEATNTLHAEFLRIVVGKVEETLLAKDHLPEKIALLHLDTDWYHSTKTELGILWPLLQRNGVMIVDDYGHWHGCQKAVNEYFSPARYRWIDKTAIMMVKN
jgi:hypothetical protein